MPGNIVWSIEDYHRYLQKANGDYVPLEEPAAPEVTEGQLQERIRLVCAQQSWLYYHTYRSTKSPKGFPDCVIVRPERPDILWLLELKREDEAPTIPQQAWLAALAQVTRVCSGVVRPSSLAQWVRRIQEET